MQRPAALLFLDIVSDQLIPAQQAQVTADADFAHAEGDGQFLNRQPPSGPQTTEDFAPSSLQDIFDCRSHVYILKSRKTFVNQMISKIRCAVSIYLERTAVGCTIAILFADLTSLSTG